MHKMHNYCPVSLSIALIISVLIWDYLSYSLCITMSYALSNFYTPKPFSESGAQLGLCCCCILIKIKELAILRLNCLKVLPDSVSVNIDQVCILRRQIPHNDHARVKRPTLKIKSTRENLYVIS